MKKFISLKSCFIQTCHTAHFNSSRTLLRSSKLNALARCLIVIAFVLIGQQVRACTISVTGVNFGSYNVFSNAAQHSAGNIGLNCASSVEYTIALGAGSGTFTQRVLSSGAHSLNYNLFTAANRALVWGDATNSTATVNGSGTGVIVNHVVHGSIPPNQNVSAGIYSDTVTVVITF
ncbi:spore coat U domain-containing protein [Amylibacter sp.]|nr:spore coat U domain-containing protein [Amylibacter sp.]